MCVTHMVTLRLDSNFVLYGPFCELAPPSEKSLKEALKNIQFHFDITQTLKLFVRDSYGNKNDAFTFIT